MNMGRRVLLGFLLGTGALLAVQLAGDPGSAQFSGPEAWQSMAPGVVRVTPPDAGPREIPVRVADDARERAQGMQNVPASAIRRHPIWFDFPEPRVTGWHMRNVRLALDIAYVDAQGEVIGVERMEPGGSGYGIDRPIAAALEVAAGQAERLGIGPGTRLELIQ